MIEVKTFQKFWSDYIQELKGFRMHHFQCVTNCKKFVTNVRRACVQSGSIAIQHDFTEALKIQHQKEIQSQHFGGNVSVSIEGYTVHYPDPHAVDGSITIFDFHSFLSDDKQQMAATVDNHMSKLIECLKNQQVLKDGGRILGSTDGCAKQYKCATAIHFMSLLSYKENVVIDRAIGTPGHGKCEVDAINGVDKNRIYREAMKTIHDPEKVSQTRSKLLQQFTVNNVEGGSSYRAALTYKHVLDQYAEGVKSEGKGEKREHMRGII